MSFNTSNLINIVIFLVVLIIVVAIVLYVLDRLILFNLELYSHQPPIIGGSDMPIVCDDRIFLNNVCESA